MESLKPLTWEKGNDKNVQATWYGLLISPEKRVLVFSIRPASNDKKTGYFLNCTLNQLFKLDVDPTLYESVEDARAAAEKTFIEIVKLFFDGGDPSLAKLSPEERSES
jgi:hypothetical protein